MNTSAVIVDPLLRRAFGWRTPPRTIHVLHEYASEPQGSARGPRDVAQRFRDEPS